MILLVNAENRGLFAADLTDMHRQRKLALVNRAAWTVPMIEHSEVDAHDRDETIYLLAKSELNGQVLASARLLPTTGPHVMTDILALSCRNGSPRGRTVWEVSRFCATPDLHGPGQCSRLLWELISGVMEAGLLYGIDLVIFPASRALLPLALDCGWEARTLGPALRGKDDEVTAVAAKINPGGLSTVRRRHGVPAPVTRLLANALPSGPRASGCKPSLEAVEGMPCPTSWIGRFCYDWPSAGTAAP